MLEYSCVYNLWLDFGTISPSVLFSTLGCLDDNAMYLIILKQFYNSRANIMVGCGLIMIIKDWRLEIKNLIIEINILCSFCVQHNDMYLINSQYIEVNNAKVTVQFNESCLNVSNLIKYQEFF